MAATDRAYTSEYSYFGQAYEPKNSYRRSSSEGKTASHEYAQQSAHAYAEHYAYERGYAYPTTYPQSPRTGKASEREKAKPELREVPKQTQTSLITHELLFKTVLLLIFAGAILIGTIWLSAKATEIQYEINKINKENVILQNEISMLDIKIESANSIEQIEDYATGTLKMQYPKSQQCIYIEAGEKASDDLVQRIKEKAYSE